MQEQIEDHGHGGEHAHDDDHRSSLSAEDLLRLSEDRLSAKQRDIGQAALDPQVDRIQRGHRQDAGQDRLDVQLRHQQSGDEPAAHAAEKGGSQSEIRMSGQRAHRRCRASAGKASIYGQIRDVQHPKRQVDAESHDRIKQPELQGADQH